MVREIMEYEFQKAPFAAQETSLEDSVNRPLQKAMISENSGHNRRDALP